MSRAKVLIVDDDTVLLRALDELLTAEGYAVRTAQSVEDALELLREATFHLVLCDLQLPGRNGISLVKTIHENCPATASVLMTGHGSVRTAVTALKRGAVEYLAKPIKPRRLLTLCRALTSDAPAFLPSKLLLPGGGDTVRLDGMVTRSLAMQAVFERIETASRADTSVLVVGECGTGKELAARSIHQRSHRAGGPFVALHTAAIAPDLIASELFGSEKSNLAGGVEKSPGKLELADGGTLFIDEIAALDERTQVHLLRVLESCRYSRVGGRRERSANVRVVAASSRNLEESVAAGVLRSDLYYRLNVFTVRLPPLRDRLEDVPALATEFLRDFSSRYQRDVSVIPPETLRLLSGYRWPGNVRELRNVVEQAMLLAHRNTLDPSLLPHMLHRQPPREELIKIPVGTSMEAVEREVILRTLAAHEGNKTTCAEALGISRRSIYNKLAEYGIDEKPAERAPLPALQG